MGKNAMATLIDAAVFVSAEALRRSQPLSWSELAALSRTTARLLSCLNGECCVYVSRRLAASWRGHALCKLVCECGTKVTVTDSAGASLALAAARRKTGVSLLTRERLPLQLQDLHFGSWSISGGKATLLPSRSSKQPPAREQPPPCEQDWEEFQSRAETIPAEGEFEAHVAAHSAESVDAMLDCPKELQLPSPPARPRSRRLVCATCQAEFLLLGAEQRWFKEHGLRLPRRCLACRKQKVF
jgi:hypothetical protein